MLRPIAPASGESARPVPPDSEAAAAQRARVIVVDDDALFRESLAHNLSDSGFSVTVFGDGPSALAHFASRPSTPSDAGDGADLVLLDWRMPTMSGIEVLRHLRKVDGNLPIIFLTALSDQVYEEAALIGGAVDFVDKSRSFSILLRRINLILDGAKGSRPPETAAAIAKHLVLRIESGRALWKDHELPLTLTEFEIVRMLAAKSGGDVGYRELYDVVHGAGFFAGMGAGGYRANVRAFIKRIRQKFRDVDPEFDCIENYAGFGYRWRSDS
jgi:two-component system, OmpR family, response regulator ChvI